MNNIADGVEVEYTGYSVNDSYPESGIQGAVSASKGKKLIVLEFRLKNTTDDKVAFDSITSGFRYKVSINSQNAGYTLITMLDNDLSGMYTDIEGGKHIDAVLLAEIPEGSSKNIDSLDLIVKKSGNETVINLK